MPDEQRVRERAHQLWEQAEAEGMAPSRPGEGPVDPVRNPAPIPPAQDLEYPAITGPVELPVGASHESQNMTEVVDDLSKLGEAGEPRAVEVPLRKRPAGSTLEP